MSVVKEFFLGVYYVPFKIQISVCKIFHRKRGRSVWVFFSCVLEKFGNIHIAKLHNAIFLEAKEYAVFKNFIDFYEEMEQLDKFYTLFFSRDVSILKNLY